MKKTKKILLAIIVALTANIAVAQTAKIHVVERGETIESIAKKYGITKDALVAVNPDAAQFVYVGMELTVPVADAKAVSTTDPSNVTMEIAETPQNSKSIESREELGGVNNSKSDSRYEYEIFAGLSINGFTGKAAKNFDTKSGFNVGLTARCYLINNFFAEASLAVATKGYKHDVYISSGDYWDDEGSNFDTTTKTDYTSYNIDVPVLIGYRLPINDDLSLKIKAGPYFTYALSGKMTIKEWDTSYSDIHSSETEYTETETKIGDIDGFKNFGCGIHTGVSVDYKHYILSAYYQRAFTKLDKSKTYEQNILLSIGYRF